MPAIAMAPVSTSISAASTGIAGRNDGEHDSLKEEAAGDRG
jgi:hypothetical protein